MRNKEIGNTRKEAQRARQQAENEHNEEMEMERLQQILDRQNIPSNVERDILKNKKGSDR